MKLWTVVLNGAVFIAVTALTGNVIFGLIGAYGFHKGRMSMQKKNEKAEEPQIEERDMMS